MSVTTATQLEPTSAVSESVLSTLKVTSSASLATQPKSTKASKVLDVSKRDHPPKRTATLKADASQPASKKSATVAKPKAAKVAKSSALSYGEMIADAIEKLAEKKGSSAVAILKYIANNHAVGDIAVARRFVYKALKRGVDRGTLVTSAEKPTLSGRFRLVKKAEKKPKAAASGDGVVKSVKSKKTSAKKTSAQKTMKKSTAASKKAPTPKKAKPSAKSTTAAKKSTAPKSASLVKKATAKTTKPTAKKAVAASNKTTSKTVAKPAKKPTAIKSATKKAIAAK